MNDQLNEAQLAVQKAREALRNNQRSEARQWAEHAASLAPQMEDPWLILAAIASPRASLDYMQKALKINPRSRRAQQGMAWARQRLQESPQAGKSPSTPQPVPPRKRSGVKSGAKRSPLYPVLLFGLGCFVCAIAAWSASSSPALASIVSLSTPTATRPPAWAQVVIPKPTYTPTARMPQVALATATPATEMAVSPPTEFSSPSATDTPIPEPIETLIPTEESTPSPEPTWSGSLMVEVVPDTPTSEIPTQSPAPAPSQPQYTSGGVHWIDVNLSQQMVYAYEGDSLVNSFVVSTGTWLHPTVTGKYHVYVKLRYTDMTGPDYYLPDVPYTMYFYKGYALHGTYWHHNFGTPMSHGCVNLSIPDAAWLYDFATVGTLVNVHY